MKKTILVVFALTISAISNAVHLSDDNTGQVLIFPYYTVNAGYNTLINLQNNTDQAKALRVRFREAAAGKEVFEFNLYLGPYDAWTSSLQSIPDLDDVFTTSIKTIDQSCTYPQLNSFSQHHFFSDVHYTGDEEDRYSDIPNRMNEGFIEVIEMGVLTGQSADATLILFEGGSPNNCQALNDAWSNDGYWENDSTTDMQNPTGGISGQAVIIDVGQGTAITEHPTVIENFSSEIINGNINSNYPTLDSGMTQSYVLDFKGERYNMNWETGYKAITSVLMKSSISSEFALDTSISAQTDWVLNLPTKHFYVNQTTISDDSIQAPFRTLNGLRTSCSQYDYKIFDREEHLAIDPNPVIDFGAPPPVYFYINLLCYSNNIATLSAFDYETTTDSIFKSHYPVSSASYNGIKNKLLTSPFESGHTTLSFQQIMTDTTSQTSIQGLPIIGFSTQKYTNANAQPGILANYAGIFKNHSTVNIESFNTPTQVKALQVSKDGIGQVLIYPYYTVRNNLLSIFSLTNHSDKVKALKVNFHEGKNSRTVLGFNLYLAPYDVWTATLVPTTSTTINHEGEDTVKLVTTDSSCTAPYAINGQEFLPYDFTAPSNDPLGDDLSRSQEGYIEVIEMGSLTGEEAIYAMHNGEDTPTNCQALVQNWFPPSGKWFSDSRVNSLAPDGSGTISGALSILDIASGADMSIDATAIINYSTQLQHTAPGDLSPTLASGSNLKSYIETENGITLANWDTSIDAVSSLFMFNQISNDFSIDTDIGAQTEWITMYPTKQFYVDSSHGQVVTPVAPFSSELTQNGACEENRFIAINREQFADVAHFGGVIVDPVPPPLDGPYYPEHCWSVNLSQVKNGINDNTILGSDLYMQNWNTGNLHNFRDFPYSIYDLNIQNGSLNTQFYDRNFIQGTSGNGSPIKLFGLPTIGFAVQKYVNGALGDGEILANYAVVNKNKGKRKITYSTLNQ